jgi:dissimilatory sulfite reductase (desulfoviridin) alpha/beta subunit
MKWTVEAEQALAKVPFFVRKRVRNRVEEFATRQGAAEVRLEHVRTCQQQFLSKMEEEVQGYRIETCFSSSGCPNRAIADAALVQLLEQRLARMNLREFLKQRVKGGLKLHHEFRISISDCPNGCSRPQIVDIGLIGARRPRVGNEPCSRCEACVVSCQERAISFAEHAESPVIEFSKCLACGQCIRACPAGTLREDASGYRILLGGKLGRHPQLGIELGPLFSHDEVLSVVDRCLTHYMEHNVSGERFGDMLQRDDLRELAGACWRDWYSSDTIASIG